MSKYMLRKIILFETNVYPERQNYKIKKKKTYFILIKNSHLVVLPYLQNLIEKRTLK